MVRVRSGDYSGGVTARLPLLLLLLLPTLAAAQDSAPQNDPTPAPAPRMGPPPPLAGIPLALRCDASIPEDHAVLRRYPGQDLNDLATLGEEEDARIWADEYLCGLLWEVLEEGGAHEAPADVRLPARAVLTATLQRLWVEGSRVVEQRIGSTVMPVSIPHWAVAMAWDFSFAVEYLDDSDSGAPRKTNAPLELSLGGTAEQDDYAPLRMGSLLRAASLEAFSDLPWLMADDGHLGDLLFALVPRPGSAPAPLHVGGPLADGFWQLLSTDPRQRHDALAFYLSSDLVPFAGRMDLARWFVLNDPDVTLRKDALGWLMLAEPADPAPLTAGTADLLAWLVLRDRSSRMRAEAVRVLSQRAGPHRRALLVAASTDEDRRVADRALTGLRDEPPPTTAELEARPESPELPGAAPWTAALDGRVSPGTAGERDQALLALALAAMSPAAETWTVRWIGRGAPLESDLVWAVDAWERLATDGTPRVRREALVRLGRESQRPSVAEVVVARIEAEREPALVVVAIDGLQRFDVRGLRPALLAASRSKDSAVRVSAVSAMTTVEGQDVQDRLTRLAAEDPTGRVRRTARKALRSRARD